MYICICKSISDQQIQEAMDDGAQNLRDVQQCSGLGTQCGKCCGHAREIILKYQEDKERSKEFTLPGVGPVSVALG